MNKIYFICILSAFFAASIFAQSQSDLLKKVQDKFESIDDFKTDFTSTYGEQGGALQTLNGKFYYKKKDKIKLELKTNVIVSDSETTWNYNIRTKKVIVNYTSEYPNTLSLYSYIFDYPNKCTIEYPESSDKNYEIIKLTANDDELNFETVQLYINSKNVIGRIVIKDLMGKEYSAKLSNLKINNGLKDSFFKFSAPDGVRVIDLR